MLNCTKRTAQNTGDPVADTTMAECLNTKEVLTLAETAKFTGLSKSYLYKLSMRRQIPHYKPRGGMLYFKRSELEQWLLSNRISTSEELSDKATAYCRCR